MSQRRLTLLDCVGIGINGIVGSGIFLVPMYVASGAASLGPLAFVACGLVCMLVALCYAEVGGMFDRSGGTYLYARAAFGEAVGFGVGWLVLVSAILGYAAVARGLGEEVARGAGWPEWSAPVLAAGLILVLGAANWRGVKTGARASDALTVIKVVPLLLFVVAGLFYVRWENVKSLGMPGPVGFAEGTYSALFALSGFEFVAVVAGETENPRRNIPLAMVASLLGAVVVYALIQLVITGVLPSVGGTQAPVVEAARVFGGEGAALAVRVVAVISMIGFCSGSALVGPRLVAALGSDGVLPRLVAAQNPVRGTPTVAILVVTLGAAAGVLALGFKELADLTILTLFAQYVPTCLAVIVFRRWAPKAKRLFRVPLGESVPLLALALMCLLISKIEWKSLATAGAILGVGILLRIAVRATARPQSTSAGALAPDPMHPTSPEAVDSR